MERANVEDIIISSDAVEELFAGVLQLAVLTYGRTKTSKTLGISMSRLHRLLSKEKTVRLTFDLVYRMHHAFGLDWSLMFTLCHENPMLSAMEKSLAGDVREISDEEIKAEEEKVRERLRKIVGRTGQTKCAEGCGIGRTTLHSYLETTSLSLALIWRIHLFADVPYSTILTGKESDEEKLLRESITDPKDAWGRFPDIHQPVVSLAEKYAYNPSMNKSTEGYVPFLNNLLEQKIGIAQFSRLIRILAMYEAGRKNFEAADALMHKGWQKLKKSKESSTMEVLMFHMGVAAVVQVPGLSKKIADHIRSMTDNHRILATVNRLQANEACLGMKMFDAERLVRKAGYHAVNIKEGEAYRDLAFSVCQWILCMISWGLGDFDETLWRTEQMLARPSTPLEIKVRLLYTDISARIWLQDVTGLGRALKQLRKYSSYMSNSKPFSRRLEIYELRLLVLKKNVQGSLSPSEEKKLNRIAANLNIMEKEIEDRDLLCILATSDYYLNGNTGGLERLLDDLLKGNAERVSAPIHSLPELCETVKEAGLWSRKLENWKKKAVEDGMQYLDLPRPGS
ncbi:MAG: hypothetical protein ACYS8W_15675 [Planctomycetota bacterium]|jgi:transcriptional regulator with XRE-family HTH domain